MFSKITCILTFYIKYNIRYTIYSDGQVASALLPPRLDCKITPCVVGVVPQFLTALVKDHCRGSVRRATLFSFKRPVVGLVFLHSTPSLVKRVEKKQKSIYHKRNIPGSSMVERLPVKERVVGSNPTRGAKYSLY